MKKLLVSTLLILITTMISNAAGIAQSFPTPINQRPPEIFSDSNANDPTPFPLTQKQLAWGTSQLEQLLKDRPRMAPYVQKGDDLWNWTVWQFAGEYKKDGISWNAQEPVPLWDAFFYDSSIAKDGERSSIQVTNRLAWKNYHFKQPKTGPVLWYETAFEILNLELASSIDQIDSLAREGKIDRKDYILGRMLIEWRTESSVRDFFKKIWIPACQKNICHMKTRT
jgi:hypothetical protein